jgi:hypothetical protein
MGSIQTQKIILDSYPKAQLYISWNTNLFLEAMYFYIKASKKKYNVISLENVVVVYQW